MPYYNSFYNRTWRRRWYRRGSSVSKSGAATFTCRIPIEDVISFEIPATVDAAQPHNWSQLVCTCPYATFKGSTNAAELYKQWTRGSLLDSYLYRTYTKIYDQCKINAVSVSIGVMEGVGNAGQLSALRLYTNWDRDLNFEEITPSAGGTGAPSTPEELATGSESQSYLIVNNSRQTFKRYIYARDVQERTTYHDCSYKVVEPAGLALPVGYWGDESWAPSIQASQSGGLNIQAGYGRSKDCGFVPSLMMSLWSPATFAANRTIPCSLKVTYSVTFRMPKFGLASAGGSSAKVGMSGLKMDAVEDVKVEMDDEKETVDVPVLKKKKVVVVEEENDEEDDELNPLLDESQEPVTVSKPVLVKKAGKKS